MPPKTVRARATRFSASFVSGIGSPRSRFCVVVEVLRKCGFEFVVVLATEGTLTGAVQVQQVAEVLLQVPDGVDGDVDSEVCGVFGLAIGIWRISSRQRSSSRNSASLSKSQGSGNLFVWPLAWGDCMFFMVRQVGDRCERVSCLLCKHDTT